MAVAAVEAGGVAEKGERGVGPRQGRARKATEGIKQLLAKHTEKTPPQWYVNGQGQTMVVIPGPLEFVMGSPPTEVFRQGNEVQHKKRISRTYAIASKPVTVQQYRQFNKGYRFVDTQRARPNCLSWGLTGTWQRLTATSLSKEEGISEDQWCYEIKGQVTKLKENYLRLTGYRLPTEAEMEYATRAAVTCRCYGETEELLPKYAWYVKNSKELTWPVGSLKPNDLGLFDVHGNAFNWCQENFKFYPMGNLAKASDDQDDRLSVISGKRVLRGGSYNFGPSLVRSAYRNIMEPGNGYTDFGFRVARTFAP